LPRRVQPERPQRDREVRDRRAEAVQQDSAILSKPGSFLIMVFEKLLDARGRIEDSGQIRVADARQGRSDQRVDLRGVPAPGDLEREPGDVAQPHLGVEQPLVQGGRAPAGRDRPRCVELRVDEQRGLVQPEQLALELPVCLLVAAFIAA
jgi:hypothetical protein